MQLNLLKKQLFNDVLISLLFRMKIGMHKDGGNDKLIQNAVILFSTKRAEYV